MALYGSRPNGLKGFSLKLIAIFSVGAAKAAITQCDEDRGLRRCYPTPAAAQDPVKIVTPAWRLFPPLTIRERYAFLAL